MTSKLGFFGGCFNPVTNAHLNLIKKVIQKENLEKVYFVPMGDFYQKENLLPLEHRIKMLELAFQNENKMQILNISNQYQKMSAIDTFQIIDKTFPEAERFFIMGSDNYKNIENWKNAEELMKNYHYIILDRQSGNMKNISSSMVREKIKQNESVESFVPSRVLDYIQQKKLYK